MMKSWLLIELWGLSVFLTLRGEYVQAGKTINQRLLQTMKSYMNFEADPCRDFYQFACGNWENLLPRKAKYLDTIGRLEYENNRQLKQILEAKISRPKNVVNETYWKVVTYYETCKDQQTFAAEEYLSIIKPTEDEEWPAVEDKWLPRQPWSIFSSLGRLQTIGFNGFLMTIEVQNLNATHFQLKMDKLQDLGLTAYEQKLLDIMDNAANRKTRLLAQNMHHFNKHLAVLARNHQQNYAKEMSLVELQTRVPFIDFKNFFSFMMGPQTVSGLRLKVANLDYFRKLADLVQKTSPDTLIHMLRLKLLGYLAQQMPQVATAQKCLQHMRNLVPTALDFIYEQEIYKYERAANDFVIKKLFKNLQNKFVDIINEHAPELSAPEQQFLKDKILQMKLNIGNLPVFTNLQFYDEYFASWQVYKDFFYWNHVNALQHKNSEKFNMLSLQWFSPQHTYFYWPHGSPAYQPSANLLIIPHTYLQYPIFQYDFHEIFLYAELGNTLGHEMLHAFDTNGLQYDSQGNPSALLIKNLPDKINFMKSLECLNKQKSSSLNEKIADISGFRLAYDTYFQRPSRPSSFRGATHLSDKQLFFVKFAQFFCAVNPKRIQYDETHDTPFVRVPQVVSNHAEFEEVFQCYQQQQPQTSRQRPEKCNMW